MKKNFFNDFENLPNPNPNPKSNPNPHPNPNPNPKILFQDYQNVEKEDKNLIFYLVMPFLKLAIFISNHARFFKIGIALTLIAGFIIYTGFALSINFGEALIPLVLGCLTVFFICWDKFMLKYEDKIGDWYTSSTKNSPTFWRLLKIISGLAVCGLLLGLVRQCLFYSYKF